MRCLLLLALAAPLASAADPVPLDPRGLPGPLVIAGGGKLSADAREAFFNLAGKEKAKIVVLSADGKEGEAALKVWQNLKVASADLITTADAKVPAALAEATGVWITGGSADALTKLYRGTATEKAVLKVHVRGGVVGGASPALAEFVLTGGPGPITDAPGFGLLPGFALNYCSDAREGWKPLAKAVADRPKVVGLAVGEGSALVVKGRVARVIGDAPITVCVAKGAGKPAANDEYKAGSLLDLCQLQRAAFNRAATEPFPPAKPPVPEVKKGALMIVGGGGSTPEMWKRFIELSGGPDATIVVVTTAMEDPLAPESGEEKILKRSGAKNVVALHTRDRKEADTPKFSEVLTKAGGVWFSGGRQWRFVDSYEGTLTAKRFHEVLARGGAIGGSSAGASIQSEYMPRGHPLGNTVVAAEGYERGFGFLPGVAVDQHFFARKRTADMTGLMKLYPQYLGIGLDEATAIVVQGHVAEVIGKSKVGFYDTRKKPDGEKDYEEVFPNGKYDLKARKAIKE